jgi:hypothetical protein
MSRPIEPVIANRASTMAATPTDAPKSSEAIPTDSQSSTRSPSSGGEKKPLKQSIKYPPYVNAYGAIPMLFQEIKKASVPPKFTQNFMENVLGLKSSSHRALIPLLKKLGFLDASNVPTEAYKQYRDDALCKSVMASQVRAGYADVYLANEYAHSLNRDELAAKLRTLTGAAEDDATISAVVGTFLELKKLANFHEQKDTAKAPQVAAEPIPLEQSGRQSRATHAPSLGLSYTINLNLPATTEIEVFNAIFRSLREHLLDAR